MTLFKNKYRIETTRLEGWDYGSDGYYYVTICAKVRNKPVFGDIQDGMMVLNEKGMIVLKTWENLINHYKNIKLHEFVIMPDHVHGIIEIISSHTVETGLKPVSTKKRVILSEIVRGFKTFSAREINESEQIKGRKIWQERFYDRIIRDEKELELKREYIKNNVLKEYLINNCRDGF